MSDNLPRSLNHSPPSSLFPHSHSSSRSTPALWVPTSNPASPATHSNSSLRPGFPFHWHFAVDLKRELFHLRQDPSYHSSASLSANSYSSPQTDSSASQSHGLNRYRAPNHPRRSRAGRRVYRARSRRGGGCRGRGRRIGRVQLWGGIDLHSADVVAWPQEKRRRELGLVVFEMEAGC